MNIPERTTHSKANGLHQIHVYKGILGSLAMLDMVEMNTKEEKNGFNRKHSINPVLPSAYSPLTCLSVCVLFFTPSSSSLWCHR